VLNEHLVVELIVVLHARSPETGVAGADGDFAGSTEPASVDVGSRGRSPGRVAGSVGVTSVKEGLVPGLHLVGEGSLGRAGVRGGTKLEGRNQRLICQEKCRVTLTTIWISSWWQTLPDSVQIGMASLPG